MNIKRSINLAMVYKGIKNQKALCNISGVGEASLSNILAGKTDPSMSTIEKIADALDYSVSDLIALGD